MKKGVLKGFPIFTGKNTFGGVSFFSHLITDLLANLLFL